MFFVFEPGHFTQMNGGLIFFVHHSLDLAVTLYDYPGEHFQAGQQGGNQGQQQDRGKIQPAGVTFGFRTGSR